MSDVFDEVDESLREDRLRTMWTRIAPYGAAILAVIVLIVGGREFVSWRQAVNARTGGELYARAMTAMEEGRLAEARIGFAELSERGRGGYKVIAQMHEAEIALREGDALAASEQFAAAAAVSDDPLLRDLASLKAVMARADSLEFADLAARLEPLAETDRPLFMAARELIGAAALKAGDLDTARERYQYIVLAPETPPAMRKRAEEALAVADARRSVLDHQRELDAASEPAPTAQGDETP